MTKISPVNNHILIEPLKHEGFIATQRETYEEIGTVIEKAEHLMGFVTVEGEAIYKRLKPGDKVYFDSWLAAKYPKEGGKTDEFYWLVKYEDVRAVEYVEPPVSE